MPQPYWYPAPVPELEVNSQKVFASADQPREAAAEVHSMRIQVATGLERTPMEILSVRVQVSVRANHKPTGGFYSIAATPGSEDTQVIYYDLIFPRCIAYGSTGSPRYVTDKVEVDSGAEQRNQRRVYPRHEYKIEMENVPANEIAEIMNLWHVCAGDHIGFLFLDPMDHTSANNDDSLSGTDVAMTDQLVAVAVGTQSDYPLYKYYSAGGHDMRRRIRYPDPETLVVAVDGYEITSWLYSYDDCLLRFQTPMALTASLSRTSGGVISGADFSALSPGDLVYIQGWSTGSYNANPGSDPARVVSADSVSLVVQRYNGTAYGNAVFTGQNVTITSALPPTGAEITAGFYFYVPVRFEDGDNMESEIKSGMRESAFADFGSISLREIFE